MNHMEGMGRLLISLGIIILLAGLLMLVLSKIGLTNFRLPGDIYIKKENFSFYFPVATCIIISIILSIILNFIGRR